MPAWRWVIGDWNVGPERELTLASSRKLVWTLTAPAQATFSLPGRSDEAGLLKVSISDLWVYADQTLVYRGRVTQTADSAGADSYTVAVTCVDYRGLLGRRLLVEGDQLNWSTPTYAAIAWGLVSATQAKTGGGLGVVQGTWTADSPPSPPVVRNYQAGLEIGKAVDDLASVAFDWEIDANLRMNLWAPSKRPASGFVADWGGTVVGFTRNADTGSWANVVRDSGDASATVGENRYASRPEGRFETQIGYPDVVLQSTVAARADADAARLLVRRLSYNLDLRPGAVNSPADVALGAQITVALKVGRLNDVGVYTVAQLSADLDDTGVTHTTVGLLS
jgi:hypothetical protein